jgi:hypothetical protein
MHVKKYLKLVLILMCDMYKVGSVVTFVSKLTTNVICEIVTHSKM